MPNDGSPNNPKANAALRQSRPGLDIISDIHQVIAQSEGKGLTEVEILASIKALLAAAPTSVGESTLNKTPLGSLAVARDSTELMNAPGANIDSKPCPSNGKVTILAVGNGNVPTLNMAGVSSTLNGGQPTSSWFVAQVPVRAGWTLDVGQVAQLVTLSFEEAQ